ncbi:MAG: hypothetical protein ACM3PY_04600 [Omnitrophica WOR_2 bacterium]
MIWCNRRRGRVKAYFLLAIPVTILMVLLAGCVSQKPILVETPATPSETPVQLATPTLTLIPTFTDTPTETPVPGATVTPAITPASTVVITSSSAVPLKPLATSPGFWFGDTPWSPDSRHFTFYSQTQEDILRMPMEGPVTAPPGTFQVYDMETGEHCQYPEQNQKGWLFNQWHAWLPDGRLAVLTKDKTIVALSKACSGETVPLAEHLPNAAERVLGNTKDVKFLALSGKSGCWLYDIGRQEAVPLPKCSRDFSFSPGGKYLGFTAGYSENNSASSIYAVPSGKLIADIPWKFSAGGLGSYGGPVWLNDEQFIVPRTDQGPLLVNIGEETKVVEIFELFGLPASPNQYALGVSPGLKGPIHLLLHDFGVNSDLNENYLYHSESGQTERLDVDYVAFSQDGKALDITRSVQSGDYEQVQRWQKPVDPPGSEARQIVPAGTLDYPTWSSDSKLLAAAVQPEPSGPVKISIQRSANGKEIKNWVVEAGTYQFFWSPDSRYLAAVKSSRTGGASGLYLFSVP